MPCGNENINRCLEVWFLVCKAGLDLFRFINQVILVPSRGARNLPSFFFFYLDEILQHLYWHSNRSCQPSNSHFWNLPNSLTRWSLRARLDVDKKTTVRSKPQGPRGMRFCLILMKLDESIFGTTCHLLLSSQMLVYDKIWYFKICGGLTLHFTVTNFYCHKNF